MKLSIIFLSLVVSVSAFGAQNKKEQRRPASEGAHKAAALSAEAIYKSLSVKEYLLWPEESDKAFAKSVGGLTCVKNPNGYGVMKYWCGLDKIESYCDFMPQERYAVDDPRVPHCNQ